MSPDDDFDSADVKDSTETIPDPSASDSSIERSALITHTFQEAVCKWPTQRVDHYVTEETCKIAERIMTCAIEQSEHVPDGEKGDVLKRAQMIAATIRLCFASVMSELEDREIEDSGSRDTILRTMLRYLLAQKMEGGYASTGQPVHTLREQGIDPRGLTLLDLGCGDGACLDAWKEEGGRCATGIDLCPAYADRKNIGIGLIDGREESIRRALAILEAQRRGIIHRLVEEFGPTEAGRRHIDIAMSGEDSYDVVMANLVLSRVWSPPDLILNCERMTAPGGHFALTEILPVYSKHDVFADNPEAAFDYTNPTRHVTTPGGSVGDHWEQITEFIRDHCRIVPSSLKTIEAVHPVHLATREGPQEKRYHVRTFLARKKND
jgi:SAM-dependent methyltransferase